ncbi:MAG: hypothetical protein M3P53_04730 [Actinomycetota bacterium]|nr:hypothetical protein [Actinomycetota bacterium]
MPEQRFCGQCGRSVVPLAVPHVERPCDECGKPVFLVEPGEGGKGIRVREGDKFTIPAGWLTMSLDPAKTTGRFFRPGVTWFVTQLMAGELPSQPHDVAAYLDKLKSNADAVLGASERLSHLDLESEADAEKAIKLLEQDRDTIEWWAFMVGTFAAVLLDEVQSGAPPGPILQAVRMQAAHSMLVFKQSLEEHVWTGYKHTRLIYDIASASARTPEDAEKIQALRPLFSQLDEDVLHAWVEGDVDIGPRLGVTGVDEPLLKGLAKYHLSVFDRRRRESELEREHSSRVWSNRIAAAGVGAALASAVIAAATAIF